jgi:hypothetical protein
MMIRLQGQREVSPENGQLLADMINFQSSFDTMMTNLRGYALTVTGFRNEYGPLPLLRLPGRICK